MISDTYVKRVQLETRRTFVEWTGSVYHRRTGKRVIHIRGSEDINLRIDLDEMEDLTRSKVINELDKKLSKINDQPFITFK